MTQGLPGRRINALLPVGARDVWVGTDAGVVRWNGTAISTRGARPRAARRRGDGHGRRSRIERLDRDRPRAPAGERARRLARSTEDARAPVTALFEDREGSLWVGTPGALERLRDSSFITYGAAEGVPSRGNGPVHVDAEGRTWLAPVDGRAVLAARTGEWAGSTPTGCAMDVVYSLAGRAHGVWVGRREGGLTRLSLQGAAAVTRTYRRADGLGSDSVYAVHESRDGTVWAGTPGRRGLPTRRGAIHLLYGSRRRRLGHRHVDRRRRRRDDLVRDSRTA